MWLNAFRQVGACRHGSRPTVVSPRKGDWRALALIQVHQRNKKKFCRSASFSLKQRNYQSTSRPGASSARNMSRFQAQGLFDSLLLTWESLAWDSYKEALFAAQKAAAAARGGASAAAAGPAGRAAGDAATRAAALAAKPVARSLARSAVAGWLANAGGSVIALWPHRMAAVKAGSAAAVAAASATGQAARAAGGWLAAGGGRAAARAAGESYSRAAAPAAFSSQMLRTAALGVLPNLLPPAARFAALILAAGLGEMSAAALKKQLLLAAPPASPDAKEESFSAAAVPAAFHGSILAALLFCLVVATCLLLPVLLARRQRLEDTKSAPDLFIDAPNDAPPLAPSSPQSKVQRSEESPTSVTSLVAEYEARGSGDAPLRPRYRGAGLEEGVPRGGQLSPAIPVHDDGSVPQQGALRAPPTAASDENGWLWTGY